jgi:hypothetical protein
VIIMAAYRSVPTLSTASYIRSVHARRGARLRSRTARIRETGRSRSSGSYLERSCDCWRYRSTSSMVPSALDVTQHHAVHPGHLVGDAVGDAGEHVVGQSSPVRGH